MPVRFSYFCRKLRLHQFHYLHLNLANRANYFARMPRRQNAEIEQMLFDCGFYCIAILIKKRFFGTFVSLQKCPSETTEIEGFR